MLDSSEHMHGAEATFRCLRFTGGSLVDDEGAARAPAAALRDLAGEQGHMTGRCDARERGESVRVSCIALECGPEKAQRRETRSKEMKSNKRREAKFDGSGESDREGPDREKAIRHRWHVDNRVERTDRHQIDALTAGSSGPTTFPASPCSARRSASHVVGVFRHDVFPFSVFRHFCGDDGVHGHADIYSMTDFCVIMTESQVGVPPQKTKSIQIKTEHVFPCAKFSRF